MTEGSKNEVASDTDLSNIFLTAISEATSYLNLFKDSLASGTKVLFEFEFAIIFSPPRIQLKHLKATLLSIFIIFKIIKNKLEIFVK